MELFITAINDDLNTPQAIAVLWDVLKDLKISDEVKMLLVLEFDKVFGLALDKLELLKDKEIPHTVIELAETRKEARAKRDFKLSDILRDEIKEKGYIISDNKDGTYRLDKIV